jgi:hypothetical protein
MSIKPMFVAVFAATLVVGLSLVAAPQAVSAASTTNPFCWTEVNGQAVERDCNSPSNVSAITNGTGSPPQAGKCYGFGFGIVEVAYSSSECVDARTEAGTPLPDPRCYRLSDDISSYHGASFDVANMSEAACDDSLASIFAERQSGFTFTGGYCYVVGAGDETSSVPCNTHDAYVWTAATQEQPGEGGGDGQPAGDEAVPIDCTSDNLAAGNCRIIGYLITAINIVTASVVVVIVGSIVAAGIQYSSARDDPQTIAKAKHRILMAVIALAMFIFGFTFLQWLVPGGIL